MQVSDVTGSGRWRLAGTAVREESARQERRSVRRLRLLPEPRHGWTGLVLGGVEVVHRLPRRAWEADGGGP